MYKYNFAGYADSGLIPISFSRKEFFYILVGGIVLLQNVLKEVLP